MDVVKGAPAYEAECARGAMHYANKDTGLSAATLNRVVALGQRALPEFDKAFGPIDRITYRGYLSATYALAGNQAESRKINAYVRDYYTRASPNPYQLVTYLARVGGAIENKYPAYATELFLEFDRVNGASDYWKASAYYKYAETARLAGNTQAESRFMQIGRSAAQRHRQYLLWYDLQPRREALEKKQWKRVAEIYTEARNGVAKRTPQYTLMIDELDMKRALALHLAKNQTESKRVLKERLSQLRSPDRRTSKPTPCLDANTLTAAAAMAMARGECKSGAKLRELAKQSKNACIQETCYPAPYGVTWCDRPSAIVEMENACRKPVTNADSLL